MRGNCEVKMKIKYCPDLITHSTRQGMLRGSGMITDLHLNECIKEECVAYKKGYCTKYHNNVEVLEKEVQDET